MPTYAVIIAAAGKSSRFGGGHARDKKVFQELNGRAVWIRTAEAFLGRDDVKQTLIVLSPEDIDWFKEKYRANLAFMDIEIVEGGAERCDSVKNALDRVRNDIDYVAVHDAARPLIAKDWITNVFETAAHSGAALLATKISSTVKRVENGVIRETVPRDHLWAAQTPQVFRRQLLLDAYSARGKRQPTDDAELVEQFGHKVAIVEGSALNLKITTREDLRMAEVLLDVMPREKNLEALHPFGTAKTPSEGKPKWLFDS